MEGITADSALLRITCFDHFPYYQMIVFDQPTIDLGMIELKVNLNELEAAEVIYRKPMYERETDRLVVNVEGTILSERGTVMELLRSAPKIIVKASGQIEVVG